jgi:hypothetical protein
VADLHDCDPIAQANQAIRDHIRACGGRLQTGEHRDRYEQLVAAYFEAVTVRDELRSDGPGALAA